MQMRMMPAGGMAHKLLPQYAPLMLASDLDGTLLDEHGQVPAKVAQAIKTAQSEGLAIRIATARPPRWLERVRELVGEHPIISANGAFIYDPAKGEVIENNGFTWEQLQEVIERLRDLPGIALSAELAEGYWREPAFPGTAPEGETDSNCQQVVAPLQEITAKQGRIGKILAVSSAVSTSVFNAEVARRLEGIAILQLSTKIGLAELSPVHVSKAIALEKEAGKLELAAKNVWAVGDMPNDLPMITWAGVGFAVRNASPLLQEQAHAIAPANTELGVAQLIYTALGYREDLNTEYERR